MKRILFLGGSHMQIPPIEYAREQGHYIITCDYIPENPGHELADEYFNISTTDKENILNLAKRKKIDGIVAYASDPAAPTAAYVAEQLELPGNSLDAVNTLTDKNRFREFLYKNGFNSPEHRLFHDVNSAKEWCSNTPLPLIIKPVDSSGSKGVAVLEDISKLPGYFKDALEHSISGGVIIEQFIERASKQIDSDVFFNDGKLVFYFWGDQHQDESCNPYAPVSISFPSTLSEKQQKIAATEIERLLLALNIKTGAFNIEFFFDKTEELWIIEVGPRNGGNLIPEVIKESTGVDLIKMTVDAALGEEVPPPSPQDTARYCASYIIHSKKHGILDKITLSEEIKSKIIKKTEYVKTGSKVRAFRNSKDSIASIIIQFNNADEMERILSNIEDFINVTVR